MASVDVASLSKQEHDELSCAYAALLLHDEGIEITVSSIRVVEPVIGRKALKGDQG